MRFDAAICETPSVLVYLAQAARHGDDSPAVRFMFERAAEPLRSAIDQVPRCEFP